MRFIDLFGGVGGFRYGLEKASDYIPLTEDGKSEEGGDRDSVIGGAFIHNRLDTIPHFECAGYYDIDRWCNAVYNYNFKETHNPTDIRAVGAESIPDHQLLCAGFPCQSFSIAGKRRGFEDTRGTLFYEICRIAEAKRPEMLLLENVYGLLSHNKGRTFAAILDSLWQMGYFLEWQVLNSKHFGVPQNRERVFIVGHLGGEPRQKVFPLREGCEIPDKENRRQPEKRERICSTIDSRYGALRNAGETYITMVKSCLTPDRLEKRQHGRRFKEDGEDMLTGQDIHGVMIDAIELNYRKRRIRRLTPIECERLQGFPDNWTKYGLINGKVVEISDTQRYRMMGNAVTTNVIEAIGKKIMVISNA